ncbi:MAG: hypothetical protein V7720_13225 [Halioglobus sp.]
MNPLSRARTMIFKCCLGIASIALIGAGVFEVPQASAQTCMQDVYRAHGKKQNLNCTANDVTLSSVSNICITNPLFIDGDNDGCQDPDQTTGKLTCIAGQPFTFKADYAMPLTAQARYDLGLYIASDSGGNDGALTGNCANNVLTNANAETFDDLDGDVCGDIDQNPNPQIFEQTITAVCNGSGDGGQVVLDYCTSWRQPGANESCDDTVFTSAASWDAYPGAPSKCNCGEVAIDVFSETATIEVTKTAITPNVLETGGNVTYGVAVKNLAAVSNVTLDTFMDTDLDPLNPPEYANYGDITYAHDDIASTTCDGDGDGNSTPIVIAAGATYTCQFTVLMGPGDAGDTVDDQVQACGTDNFGHTNLCDDDPAQVTYTDVSTKPSLTKTPLAEIAYKVDVQYGVAVMNKSTVDTLVLDSLSDDKFGDITSVHAAGGGFAEVLSTNCATGGTIAAGGNYNCKFTGRITAEGPHTNKVTAGATDDDQVTYGAPELQDTANVNISVTFP